MSELADTALYYRDLGLSYGEIGRRLRVTRQRAHQLVRQAERNGDDKWAEIDPKGVLPNRVKGTLKRVGLTAREAVETEAWNHTRGLGDGSRELLLRHYS